MRFVIVQLNAFCNPNTNAVTKYTYLRYSSLWYFLMCCSSFSAVENHNWEHELDPSWHDEGAFAFPSCWWQRCSIRLKCESNVTSHSVGAKLVRSCSTYTGQSESHPIAYTRDCQNLILQHTHGTIRISSYSTHTGLSESHPTAHTRDCQNLFLQHIHGIVRNTSYSTYTGLSEFHPSIRKLKSTFGKRALYIFNVSGIWCTSSSKWKFGKRVSSTWRFYRRTSSMFPACDVRFQCCWHTSNTSSIDDVHTKHTASLHMYIKYQKPLKMVIKYQNHCNIKDTSNTKNVEDVKVDVHLWNVYIKYQPDAHQQFKHWR